MDGVPEIFNRLNYCFMKKLCSLCCLVMLVQIVIAQVPSSPEQADGDKSKEKKQKKPIMGLGFKGGLNFANITNASSINSSSRTGFAVGVFFSPPSKGIISSRTELLFSRQGYNFQSGAKTGSVDLNYIILPQLMGINITKYVQLQVGAQMAYLLNAKADSSTTSSSSTPNPYSKIMDYYNRFDYGAAGGIEVYPVRNLLIGARFNISFGSMYKDMANPQPGTTPNFIPKVDVKNNVLQLFLGLRF
jgi:hypothetical protein